MKQTRWLSEFGCMSEYTRLYPIQTVPEVIKLCSCSTQLGMDFIKSIHVKMPTIVGILTFINMINKYIIRV